MWFEQMHPGWQELLRRWEPWLAERESHLSAVTELAPAKHLVMRAFEASPESIHVVLLGQDPYPTPDVAIGRAFAVAEGAAIPGSLRNLFEELESDIGGPLPNRTLDSWQRQGVWLLNRHLTTVAGESATHFDQGWASFTDAAIAALIQLGHPLVLLLLGNQAQTLLNSLSEEIHAHAQTIGVVSAVHPSPLSAHRGFFGSAIYSRVNAELSRLGAPAIEWCADNHAT